MFRLALTRAELDGSAALIIGPHDPVVRAMWIREYHFSAFTPDTGKLWFPIGRNPQGYP